MKLCRVFPTRNEGLFSSAATKYLVQTPSGVLYVIFNTVDSDLYWTKSTDNGLTWSTPTLIFTGTVVSHSIWYDRWSGIAGDLIHIAWIDSGVDDIIYRTLDTSSDSLSTQTNVFLGTTTATGGTLSICRSRGGNVYVAGLIDAGAEGGFFRLPNANVPNGAWDAARATCFEAVTSDMVILMPGFAADNQDMILLYLDASANEWSRKLYDDSANSWAETSIATGILDAFSDTVGYPNFAAVPDLTNSKIVFVTWNDFSVFPVPTTSDLVGWTIDESSITAMANIITNSAGNQDGAGVAVAPDGSYWVIYNGKSDGSQPEASQQAWVKRSTDQGANWSAEFQYAPDVVITHYGGGRFMCPRPYFTPPPAMGGISDSSGNPYMAVWVTRQARQPSMRIGFNG